MSKKKVESTCFEPGQIVRLKKPILLWGNAWLGIEYRRYKVDLNGFVIDLPASNLEAEI